MKTLMFDLDGTLLDTLEDIGRACNAILAEHGYPVHPLPAYRRMVGNGFTTLMRRALPENAFPETSPELAALVDKARAWYGDHMCEHTRPYEGLPQVLECLARNGTPLSVLSNKPEQLVRQIVAHYYPEIPFAHVCGGREDMPLKPAPDAVLKILAAMRIAPEDCCYIGDSLVDCATARNAGTRFAAVTWGFGTVEELKQAGVTTFLEHAGEIADLVK